MNIEEVTWFGETVMFGESCHDEKCKQYRSYVIKIFQRDLRIHMQPLSKFRFESTCC